MQVITLPKYTQHELISMITQKDIDLLSKGYEDLHFAIQNEYVFNKKLFLQSAEVLGLDKNEVFEKELSSDISFRGLNDFEQASKIIEIFGLMVEQSKIRGNTDV